MSFPRPRNAEIPRATVAGETASFEARIAADPSPLLTSWSSFASLCSISSDFVYGTWNPPSLPRASLSDYDKVALRLQGSSTPFVLLLAQPFQPLDLCGLTICPQILESQTFHGTSRLSAIF